MTGKTTKRALGLVCLVFSGLLLIWEISVLVIPSMAEMANRSVGDHVRSLLMVFVIGGVGLHLRRARTAESSVFVIRLIIFVLFLTPLLDIQVALKAIHEFEPIAWFPSIRSVLAALSLFFIALPYVLGGRIVTYQSRGVSRSSETPHTALYIIGLACALLPSTIAAFSVFVGLPADNIYYFVALSYLAAAAWSAWWYYRHSRPREKSFTAG